MKRVTAISPAKINLTLHISGTEGGFHMLDSLVVTADLCDYVTASRRDDCGVTLQMRGMGSESISFESNNAARAAKLFIQRFGTRGADITVEKRIPIGAGLGGSSADAAGVLNALAALYGIADFSAVEEIADAVGSDTRYMLKGGWARLKGRGNAIESIKSPLRLFFVIIAPQSGVSAAECYRLYDELAQSPSGNSDGAVKAAVRGDFPGLGRDLFNALYVPAKTLSRDVCAAAEEASGLSPSFGMTGSGSAAFAAFSDGEKCLSAYKKYKGKFRAYMAETCLPRVQYGE